MENLFENLDQEKEVLRNSWTLINSHFFVKFKIVSRHGLSLLQTFSHLWKHKKTESECKVKECDEVKEATFEDRKKTCFWTIFRRKNWAGPLVVAAGLPSLANQIEAIQDKRRKCKETKIRKGNKKEIWKKNISKNPSEQKFSSVSQISQEDLRLTTLWIELRNLRLKQHHVIIKERG